MPNPHVECGAILIKENQFSVFYIFVIIELRLIISNGLFLEFLHFTIHWTLIPNPQLGVNLIKENQFSVFYIFDIIELRLLLCNGLITHINLLEVAGGC